MSANPIAVPLTIDSAGPQPTPVATLRAALEQSIAAAVPGYTADLPGTLIEDILSTDTASVATMDQARVDAINGSLPIVANPYTLALLGQQAGLAQGLPTNTSVLVVFSGSVGLVIPAGFLVGDGTYQYTLQQATIIGTNGTSAPAYCVATQTGIWTPLANTVTTVVSAVPPGYTITCNNPEQGTPGTGAESVESYQSRLIQAQTITGLGTATYCKTLLKAIPGVQSRLVSVKPAHGGLQVICGGGDPYAVALAIYMSGLYFPLLLGSQTYPAVNVTVSITDAPNNYSIIYVNPIAQTLTGTVTWNTQITGFTQAQAVNQAGQQAVTNYANSIPVGEPFNILDAQNAFQQAVSSILPTSQISSLVFSLLVNGSAVSPEAGTQVILSPGYAYFSAAANGITVQQG